MNADGMTILYTSHYMEEVEHLCEEIAIMDRGKVIAAGTVKELLARHGQGVIEVKTLTPVSGVVEQELLALPDLSRVECKDRAITLMSNSPTRTIPQVIALLEGRGIRITSLMHGAANLEQLFMSLTGTVLRD